MTPRPPWKPNQRRPAMWNWIILGAALILGGSVGFLAASLILLARAADDNMADLWDDDWTEY